MLKFIEFVIPVQWLKQAISAANARKVEIQFEFTIFPHPNPSPAYGRGALMDTRLRVILGLDARQARFWIPGQARNDRVV